MTWLVPEGMVVAVTLHMTVEAEHPRKVPPAMVWKGLARQATERAKEFFGHCSSQEERAAIWLKALRRRERTVRSHMPDSRF